VAHRPPAPAALLQELQLEPHLPFQVTFRQKPWLPWWMPPTVALLAASIAATLL
jgi:hypothetical protein